MFGARFQFDDGHSSYPGMGEVWAELGEVAAPAPTSGYPTSGDPRQQAVNSPAQVRVDAANFRLLDYPAPDTGNAYDPQFRAVVKSFQGREGLTADGLIGPITRTRLVQRVSALPGLVPVSPPAIIPAPSGAPPIPPPAVTPASTLTASQSSTLKKVGIAAGVGGALLAAYYLLK